LGVAHHERRDSEETSSIGSLEAGTASFQNTSNVDVQAWVQGLTNTNTRWWLG